MSNRPPHVRNPAGRRSTPWQPPHEPYTASGQNERWSPILTIILILAAFTCLFLCAIVLIIPLRLLLS
jgi:hypothetical protein